MTRRQARDDDEEEEGHSDAFDLLEAESDVWSAPWSEDDGEAVSDDSSFDEWDQDWASAGQDEASGSGQVAALEHASSSAVYIRAIVDAGAGVPFDPVPPARIDYGDGPLADPRDHELPADPEEPPEHDEADAEPEPERTSKDLLHQAQDAWGESWSTGPDEGVIG